MTTVDPKPSGALTWRVHPAAERPALALVVGALILLLGVLAGVWMGSPYWGVFATVVLLLSLEAFFLPASFELSESGVRVRKPFSQVERPWDAFRRVVFDPAGVTLSPFAERRWIEPYRALRLRYRTGSSAGEDDLPARVRECLLAHCDPQRVRMVGLSAGEQSTWEQARRESPESA